MKRIGAVLLLLPLLIANVHAQNTATGRDFHGIDCRGPVPADLRKSMEQLYNEDKQRVRDYTGGKLSNRDKVLNASYYITRLVSSGLILYGDPVTTMLEHIVDTLLADQPALRKELRIYSVKSSDINAFATGQGMIFVNLGLVAQVEDEAQLAFVLSHEIIHYVRKHSLENLTRKNTARDTTGKGLEEFLRYHSRSREMESEADSLGIALFYGKSPYNKRVGDGFFDVLQYGYLPFDEVEFDTTQFNTPLFKLSHGSFLEKVNPITARDDYNDSLSTHPNLLKRRLATTRMTAAMHGGERFVVTTANEFANLQMLARMECIRQDIIHAEYASAYYNCYVLLQQNPDNEYLRLAKAQAIYGASKYRTYAAASNVSDYRSKEGSVQQAYHFMRRTKPSELCIVAIRELWTAGKSLGGDSRINDMTADLMHDLACRHNFHADRFANTTDTSQAASPQSQDTVTTTQGNQKYSNVKRRRRQQQSDEACRYAFADLMQADPTFQPMLEKAMINNNSASKPTNLAGKSTFLFPTNYYVYNARKEELKIKESAAGNRHLAEAVTAVNKEEGMQTVDFSDITTLPDRKADSYNDFMRLGEWASEFWQTGGKVPLIFSSQPSMDELIGRYKADKLSLSTVVNIENTHVSNGTFVTLIGLASIVATPIALYGIAANREATGLHTTLVDTRTGQVLASGRSAVAAADSKALLRSQTHSIIENDLHLKKAPGYMGRHLMVTANGGLCFPLLNRPFRENTDLLALRWGGSIEYAIGQQSSLALSADFGSTPFDIQNETALIDAAIGTYSITYRHYSGDNIAPLGTYLGIGPALSSVKLTPQTGQQPYYVDNSYLRSALQLEFGRNYIFYDRIVLNIGVRYNFTLALPFEKMDFYYVNNDNVRKTNAVRSMNANLWMYNLIVLNVGIGLLPF